MTVSASAVSPAVSADFNVSTNKVLTIAAGNTASTGTVTITAVDNLVDAANKTVTVSATATGGGVASPSNKTLTITDDESTPTVDVGIKRILDFRERRDEHGDRDVVGGHRARR